MKSFKKEKLLWLSCSVAFRIPSYWKNDIGISITFEFLDERILEFRIYVKFQINGHVGLFCLLGEKSICGVFFPKLISD